MEEHFTTYTRHNHHHYYNIMHYQRFTFNFNLNFIILSQFEKKLMENCSFFFGFIQSLWLQAMYNCVP
jgi:hypothetical protein